MAMRTFPVTDANLLLAPYVWKCVGTGASSRAEATMPGAYVKAQVRGTDSVGLLVDGTANAGCSADLMPVVDVSIDGGEFKSTALTARNGVYTLCLAEGLVAGASHRVEIFFRAASLGLNRWRASTARLRIAGLQLAAGGSLHPCQRLPGNALAFGDSITEGVCVEGLCPYYSNLLMNNARATWVPFVCSALQCEYGQLGTGGQGMVKPIEIPPLPQTWDRYDADTSRLTGGLLLPEPDYVLCCMGTNDYEEKAGQRVHLDIADAYAGWLAAVRGACPKAVIFCIAPPLGWHATEIAAAVARRKAEDHSVHFIDTAPLKDKFGVAGATQLALDGVHPSVYGNAMLGALIAAEVIKQLRRVGGGAAR